MSEKPDPDAQRYDDVPSLREQLRGRPIDPEGLSDHAFAVMVAVGDIKHPTALRREKEGGG